jgi:phosphoribosylformylglycinamidine synthase subunit PurS
VETRAEEKTMIVRVFVALKPSVLDPQGIAIQKALNTMGYAQAAEVRQGKYFEICWRGSLSDQAEREQMEAIAARVLSNPVIESYRIEWPEGGQA